MNDQLRLDRVRNVLVRLEETIIFSLIERAQFCRNEVIYEPGALGEALEGHSLVGYLLHETEKTHARLRRYTSPDEHPFFADLPSPVLPALAYESPLFPNSVNVNERLWCLYEEEIVPSLCREGDDRQYGSSAVNDVMCLQALSKRVHYGKFVAESKVRAMPERLGPLVRAGDGRGLMAAITDPDVESGVVQRVERKCRTYLRDLEGGIGPTLDPLAIVSIYSRWIIPMNKEVQVAYLLQRGDWRPRDPEA